MISFTNMYELMVAAKADSAAKLFEMVEKMLKGANASSVASSKMGKKSLAYPIKKQTEAEYFVFNFEAPPESLVAISDGLRLEQEMVLRYMIVTRKVSKVSNVSKVSKAQEEQKVETKAKATVKVAAKVKTTVKSKVEKPKGTTKSKGN